MKNRKVLPLSLSIAAISLLVAGFSNVGLLANAAPQDTVAPAAEAPAAPSVVPLVAPNCGCVNPGDCGIPGCPQAACLSSGCTAQAEATVATTTTTPTCSCANPGDCGIPGCPQAACITAGCAGQTVDAVLVSDETATDPGCLCQDGGCGKEGCPGAGCDGTNCPGIEKSGCGGCGGKTSSGCGCSTSSNQTQPSGRSGCGCRG